MAWSAPLTAVSNTALTAAQWNASVRDNLNETAPAKATTAGSIFVATGTNAIAERIPGVTTIATAETTASTTYANLTTVGPQVGVTTGTKAIAIWAVRMSNNTAGQNCFASVSLSGATPTIPGNDAYTVRFQAYGSNATARASCMHMYTGLTAGVNNFTVVYRVDGGTGNFADRELVVIPL
jgi:hypothetical protein